MEHLRTRYFWSPTQKVWKPHRSQKGIVKDPKTEIMKDGERSDIIIPIIGKTGVGRSTFINKILEKEEMQTSDGMSPCTADIRYAAIDPKIVSDKFPRLAGRRVLLVDTPGFQDDQLPDVDILRKIAVWLASSYYTGMKLGGMIYLHDISDRRFHAGRARKMARLLQGLVGDKAEVMERVVLATTMWDEGLNHHAAERVRARKLMEDEITKVWEETVIGKGAIVKKYESTSESAWDILDLILGRVKSDAAAEKDPASLLIQDEIVSRRLLIMQTTAAKGLFFSSEEPARTAEQLPDVPLTRRRSAGSTTKSRRWFGLR